MVGRIYGAVLTLLLLTFTAPAAAQSNNPNWQPPDPSQYSGNMIVSAVVYFNGEPTRSALDTVAFFIGGELRGLSEPIAISQLPEGVFQAATVFANNEEGAAVGIRVYHAATDRVYVLDQGLEFRNGAVVGNFTEPYEIRIAVGPGGVGQGTLMLAAVPEQTTTAGVAFDDLDLLDFTASSSAGAVSYSLSQPGAGVDFELTGSVLSATPRANFTGVATVRVAATEAANGDTDEQTLSYRVLPGAATPVFQPVPEQTAVAGEQFAPLDLGDFVDPNGAATLVYDYEALLPDGPPVSPPLLTPPTGFSGSMTVTARAVYTDSHEFAAAGNVLAAYVGGELRGVATPIRVVDQVLYFLSIATNTARGEEYSLVLFDAERQQRFDYPVLQAVLGGEQVGTVPEPNVYDFSPITLEVEPTTGNVTALRQDVRTASELRIIASAADATAPTAARSTQEVVFRAVGEALPAELLRFSGVAGRKHIRLSWEVGHETAVADYAIERASVADAAFTRIGRMPASGARAYDFTDAAAPLTGAYYRLRIRDLDGSEALSNVIYLLPVAGGIYPNPVSSGATVILAGGQTNLLLFDGLGRVVWRGRSAADGRLALPRLAAGRYVYRSDNGRRAGVLVVE